MVTWLLYVQILALFFGYFLCVKEEALYSMVIRNHDLKRPTKIMNEFLFFFVCMLKHPCWKKHVVYDFFLFVFGPFFVVFVIIFFIYFQNKSKSLQDLFSLIFWLLGFYTNCTVSLIWWSILFLNIFVFLFFLCVKLFLYVCKKNENIFILFYVRTSKLKS